jgi:hypothetical protein
MDNTEIQTLKLYINSILSRFKGERFDYFNSNKNLIQNVIGQYLRNKYNKIDYLDINTFNHIDNEQIVKYLNEFYNNNEGIIIRQRAQSNPGLDIRTPEDDEEGIKMTKIERRGGKTRRKLRGKTKVRKSRSMSFRKRKTRNYK